MTKNDIATFKEAEALPDGQWAQDADGDYICLVDTHLGFPQRMVMPSGGKYLMGLSALKLPIHLADFQGDCEHKWGLIAEGHCRRCGTLIDWSPVYFDPEQMAVFEAVARRNAENEEGMK